MHFVFILHMFVKQNEAKNEPKTGLSGPLPLAQQNLSSLNRRLLQGHPGKGKGSIKKWQSQVVEQQLLC